ncbi:hypothetical protein HaLaN_28300, partial [Haematococcus lacustris]
IARTAAGVDGQQQQAVGVWQCRLQVAAGCRCAAVHEQKQQAAVHVLQCIRQQQQQDVVLYQQSAATLSPSEKNVAWYKSFQKAVLSFRSVPCHTS